MIVADRLEKLIRTLRPQVVYLPYNFKMELDNNLSATFDYNDRQVVVTANKVVRYEKDEWARNPIFTRGVANGIIDRLPQAYRSAILSQAVPKSALPVEAPGGILDQV